MPLHLKFEIKWQLFQAKSLKQSLTSKVKTYWKDRGAVNQGTG